MLSTSCDAKIDWKALSQRIGHADVAFTIRQYVQTDPEAGRQVAKPLAELIIGGTLAFTVISDEEREEDLAAHVAGRERRDADARWDELLPAYQDLAASIG